MTDVMLNVIERFQPQPIKKEFHLEAENVVYRPGILWVKAEGYQERSIHTSKQTRGWHQVPLYSGSQQEARLSHGS